LAAEDLAQLERAIYRLEARQCQSEPTTRSLTGFRLTGQPGLLTALHGVVGCNLVVARRADGDKNYRFVDLKIRRVDFDYDIAELVGPADLERAPQLPVAGYRPMAGAQLYLAGFPIGVQDLLLSHAEIRIGPGTRTWQAMSPAAAEVMTNRESPKVTSPMLDIEAHIVPHTPVHRYLI
jgi:hypothetical protein